MELHTVCLSPVVHRWNTLQNSTNAVYLIVNYFKVVFYMSALDMLKQLPLTLQSIKHLSLY